MLPALPVLHLLLSCAVQYRHRILFDFLNPRLAVAGLPPLVLVGSSCHPACGRRSEAPLTKSLAPGRRILEFSWLLHCPLTSAWSSSPFLQSKYLIRIWLLTFENQSHDCCWTDTSFWSGCPPLRAPPQSKIKIAACSVASMCPVLTFEGFLFLPVPSSFYAVPCSNETWLCPVLSKKICCESNNLLSPSQHNCNIQDLYIFFILIILI